MSSSSEVRMSPTGLAALCGGFFDLGAALYSPVPISGMITCAVVLLIYASFDAATPRPLGIWQRRWGVWTWKGPSE
jgi:hypothetical protein